MMTMMLDGTPFQWFEFHHLLSYDAVSNLTSSLWLSSYVLFYKDTELLFTYLLFTKVFKSLPLISFFVHGTIPVLIHL